MLAHLLVLRRGQLCRFVEDLAADVQFADIVQQGGGAHVFDAFVVESHLRGDARGVDRDAIGVVLGIGIFGDEVPQNHQHAVIGVAQFADSCRVAVIQGAHGEGGKNQRPAPYLDVEPLLRAEHLHAMSKQIWIHNHDQNHEQDAGQRSERGVTPSIMVGGEQGRKGIEAEQHATVGDQKIASAAMTNNESTSQSSRFTSVNCFSRLFFKCNLQRRTGEGMQPEIAVRTRVHRNQRIESHAT